MPASCRDPVTASLSGGAGPVAPAGRAASRLPDRRCEGLPQCLGLLGRQGRVGSAGHDGLRVQPRPGPGMQAADDETVAPEVGHGKREALVAAGVLEGVEPDEADSLDRPPPVRLEDRGSGRQLVELAGNRVDLVEVRVEDRLEPATVRIAGDPVEAATQSAKAARLDEDGEDEHENDDGQTDDDHSDGRRDQAVEVDVTVLRQASNAVIFGRADTSRWRRAGNPDPSANAILRGSQATPLQEASRT